MTGLPLAPRQGSTPACASKPPKSSSISFYKRFRLQTRDDDSNSQLIAGTWTSNSQRIYREMRCSLSRAKIAWMQLFRFYYMEEIANRTTPVHNRVENIAEQTDVAKTRRSARAIGQSGDQQFWYLCFNIFKSYCTGWIWFRSFSWCNVNLRLAAIERNCNPRRILYPVYSFAKFQ